MQSLEKKSAVLERFINYYKMWRKTHLDDSRVYQHAVKYHVIEEDIYHEYKSIVPIL